MVLSLLVGLLLFFSTIINRIIGKHYTIDTVKKSKESESNNAERKELSSITLNGVRN